MEETRFYRAVCEAASSDKTRMANDENMKQLALCPSGNGLNDRRKGHFIEFLVNGTRSSSFP